MNLLLIVSSLLGLAICGPAPAIFPFRDGDADVKFFAIETSPGVYEVEDLVDNEVEARVSPSDIVYHFFTQKDSEVGIDVTNADFKALKRAGFSVKRDTVFVVHGWKGDNISDFNNAMRQAFLAKYDVNLFMVDWRPIANRRYTVAKNSVVGIGQITADFLKSLVDKYNLNLSDVSFVGYSLGAHISGNTGAALNGKLGTIVGLDPAGPLFSTRRTNERLDPTDAKYVHVIHTNGGLLGFGKPSGHADYFPNGGSSQPGCGVDLFGTCAHDRAYKFFEEAILSDVNGFVAKRCSRYRDFTRGRCSSNLSTRMGDLKSRSGSGDYYLDTNARRPFAKG